MTTTADRFLENVTFSRVNGLRYALRDHGPKDGKPVILAHGFADTGASFTFLVEVMEALKPDSYRFIAPDWRGHGDSEHTGESYWFPQYLADLDAIISHFAGTDQTVALVGHSMGGQIVSQYAGLRPERVSHLITLDSLNAPAADSSHAVDRYRRWLDALASTTADPRVYDSRDQVARNIGKRYPELNPRQRHFLAEQWTKPVPGGYGMRLDPWHRMPFPYGFRLDDAMAMWRQVSAPVLCLDAEHSLARHYVDATEMSARRACFARIAHRVIPGAGHMLHIQAPEAVAREATGFFDETVSTADNRAATGRD